jgi:IPT/TIG domain.
MPTPGSETYKSTNPLETRDKNTYSSRIPPDVNRGPDVPVGPTVTSVEPNTLTVADPETEAVITGSGFTTESVIVWNGGDEATAFIDGEHVSTIVRPSTVEAPLPCTIPVAVRNGILLSDPVSFTFTSATPEEGETD